MPHPLQSTCACNICRVVCGSTDEDMHAHPSPSKEHSRSRCFATLHRMMVPPLFEERDRNRHKITHAEREIERERGRAEKRSQYERALVDKENAHFPPSLEKHEVKQQKLPRGGIPTGFCEHHALPDRWRVYHGSIDYSDYFIARL